MKYKLAKCQLERSGLCLAEVNWLSTITTSPWDCKRVILQAFAVESAIKFTSNIKIAKFKGMQWSISPN